MTVLTLTTAGSVDDGKSTLVGRLLLELGAIPADVAQAWAARGADAALLLDGLEDEAAQGITIDVAWRSLDFGGRRLRFADAPGHEQYLSNMATAASHADALLLVVDALTGPRAQSWRHARIARLMGVRRAVVAVTKMDAAGWRPEAFRRAADGLVALLRGLGAEAQAVPVSGLTGEHVVRPGPCASWGGPPLARRLALLVPPALPPGAVLPVQWTGRAGRRRLVAGRMAGGSLAPGDEVALWPGGRRARIGWIEGVATERSSVMLGFEGEIDAPRGTVLTSGDSGVSAADALAAELVVLSAQPLLPGRRFRARVGAAECGAQLLDVRHATDPETGHPLAARAAEPDALVRVNVGLDRPLAWRADCRSLGRLLLLDAGHGAPLAAGPIVHALRRADTVRWQQLDVTPADRARLIGQRPAVAWLTGLPGSGKSTIANLVDRRLHVLGRASALLDGDNLRHGLCRDLGFTPGDRVENLRRAAEASRLLADSGLFVICALISPFRADRAAARQALAPHPFLEVFVDTPAPVCEARDPKGLWARARAGEIPNFTGVGQPYEPPEAADLVIDTGAQSAADAASRIVDRLLAL